MANTFKLLTRDVAPAGAGTPETIYTVQSGSTLVVLGLTLCNVHTAQVTATVQIVSRGATNGTSFLAKNVPIAVGQSIEILSGGKVILETGDLLRLDCSVTDKLSGTLSIMEIT